MLKLLSVHKKKVIFFSIILLLVIFVTFEAPNIKNYLYKKYPNFSLHKEFRGEKSLREHIENDYNVYRKMYGNDIVTFLENSSNVY